MTEANSSNALSAILTLIHDPVFVQFELEQESPTIFNAVGRTHTETWHSALLGWLLDPQGSHGLKAYPLSRLLLLAQINDKRETRNWNLHHLLAEKPLTNARVRPNERELAEVSVASVGRFDVFIDEIQPSEWKQIHILVEVKVGAAISQDQCAKYITYVEQNKKLGITVIPIFIAPDRLLTSTPKQMFGSDEWIALSFQHIYDDVIAHCLKHSSLSVFGKNTLEEYIKTLKYPLKGGYPMITTQEDRVLVQKLFENHETAIRNLYEILSQSEVDINPLITESNEDAPIKITIGSMQIQASSITKLYEKVLKYLVDNGHLEGIELPIATGTKRYLIAREPKHQQGNEFIKQVGYKGFYMEANKSRSGGISDLVKLIQACGLEMKTLTQ